MTTPGGSGLGKAPPRGNASGFPTGLGKPRRDFPSLPQPLLRPIDKPIPTGQERRRYEGVLTMGAMETDPMV